MCINVPLLKASQVTASPSDIGPGPGLTRPINPAGIRKSIPAHLPHNLAHKTHVVARASDFGPLELVLSLKKHIIIVIMWFILLINMADKGNTTEGRDGTNACYSKQDS